MPLVKVMSFAFSQLLFLSLVCFFAYPDWSYFIHIGITLSVAAFFSVCATDDGFVAPEIDTARTVV
jgi:hypothetical protein